MTTSQGMGMEHSILRPSMYVYAHLLTLLVLCSFCFFSGRGQRSTKPISLFGGEGESADGYTLHAACPPHARVRDRRS